MMVECISSRKAGPLPRNSPHTGSFCALERSLHPRLAKTLRAELSAYKIPKMNSRHFRLRLPARPGMTGVTHCNGE